MPITPNELDEARKRAVTNQFIQDENGNYVPVDLENDNEQLRTDNTLDNIRDSQVLSPVPGGIFAQPVVSPSENALESARLSGGMVAKPDFNQKIEEQQKILGIPLDKVLEYIQKNSPKREIASIPEAKQEEKKEEVTTFKNKPSKAPKLQSSESEFMQAEDAANSNRLTNALTRSGIQVGAALAGGQTKADYSTIDEIAKGNDVPIEQYKAHQAQKANDVKLNEEKLKLNTERLMSDPNHPISQLARDILEKKFKVKLPENITASQLDKAGLLKSVLKAVAEQASKKQSVVVEENGKNMIYTFDTKTGKYEPAGLQKGFSFGNGIDPATGQPYQVSKSNRELPSAANSVEAGKFPNGSTATSTPTQLQPVTGQVPTQPGEQTAVPSQETDKPKYNFNIKQQNDLMKEVDRIKKEPDYQAAEKVVANASKIKALLKEAHDKGGQSYAIIGPQIAKQIAGDSGNLSENDVTRYVKNPEWIQGAIDTIQKLSSGRLSDVSYENLDRLLDIMATKAEDTLSRSRAKGAETLHRVTGLPLEQAMYGLDDSLQQRQPESAPIGEYSGLTPEQRRAKIKELDAKVNGSKAK